MTRFDVVQGRLTETAVVLSVELTRTLVSKFERGAGCIDSLSASALGGREPKLLLILKRAHRD